MTNRLFSTTAFAIASVCLASAQDHYLLNQSTVGVVNSSISYRLGAIPPEAADNTATSSSYSAVGYFYGMDRNGNAASTYFSGSVRTSSQYGRLHAWASGDVQNSFYNENNPVYYDSRDDSYHPEGTPDGYVALGFAGFTDTLQFGGALQSGYTARYVFHVDGYNMDFGATADLGATIAGDPTEYASFLQPGGVDTVWATRGHSVNGQTPQTISVVLDAQFADYTRDHADGANVYGVASYESTATFTGIVLFDAGGNVVPTSDWTVTSTSGTTYAKLDAVPEPGSLAALAGAALVVLRRRTRRL